MTSPSRAPVIVDDKYRSGWDDIFGKKNVEQVAEEEENSSANQEEDE